MARGRRLRRSGVYFSASCSCFDVAELMKRGAAPVVVGSAVLIGREEDTCGVMVKRRRRRRRRKKKRKGVWYFDSYSILYLHCLLGAYASKERVQHVMEAEGKEALGKQVRERAQYEL
ncbi:hypothetical protein GW17_00042760 [Ensete ventricosum]|nr:hypothetical protein GW17_00042760 [Ensete ventricosum]